MNIPKKHEIYKPNKTQLFVGLLLIASPWMILFITTGIIAHHSVFYSAPCWSDELSYWHEILSFSQKGLDFGYYTINEALPKCLSFGSHGFGSVSVYALFGKIFGWKTYSIVIANAFFMSLAFLFLNVILKPSSKSLLYIWVFSLTYTPLILFSSTSMTELLNYSVLIVYFSMLYVYFKRGSKNLLVSLLLFCTIISFIRIIYVVLFLPLLFKRNTEFQFDLKFVVSIVLWIAFSALLFVLNNIFVSPYPDSFLNESLSSKGFSEFVSNFVTHFVQNAWNLINPFSENTIQVLNRYFVIFVCLACLVKSRSIQTRFKKIEIGYFIVFLILFLFLLINIAAYDVFDWRDYRVLAPVLFGSVLFLMLNGKRFIIYFSLAVNLLGIIFLLVSPHVLQSFNNGRYSKSVENKLLNNIEYSAQSKSRYENTIVVQQFSADVVLNVPAGIGITCSDTLSDKLNSKYIYSKSKLELLTYKIIDSNESGHLYQKISTN
jgi:hypothetical protein